MPKCVKLGWNLPIMPGQYEVGVWKRNYIENIKTLQIMFPKVDIVDVRNIFMYAKLGSIVIAFFTQM